MLPGLTRDSPPIYFHFKYPSMPRFLAPPEDCVEVVMAVAVVVVTVVALELVAMGSVLELAVSAADLELAVASFEAVAVELSSLSSLRTQ